MLGRMSRDIIDDMQEDWSEERPDLDSEAMGVVLRIQALDKILGDQVAERLRDFGLQWWQYDVLSALRRQGKPFLMAATELAESTMLTSGAMTNRIDRLESKGLVRRLLDPADRRRMLVELTAQGHRQVENATRARFEIASSALARLDRKRRKQLSDLLRQLLLAQDETQLGEGN